MRIAVLSLLLTLAGEVTHLEVEVMRTPAELRRGLQGHPALRDDQGMLFILDDLEIANFWMKDVTYPIDIVFLRPDGTVDHVAAAVPPCPETPCPNYRSKTPVSHVLELRAGRAAELGLTPGHPVRLAPEKNRVTIPPLVQPVPAAR